MPWLFNSKRNSNSSEHSTSNDSEHHDNQYIHKQGNEWVVVNKKGEVMSHHDTREKAEESFRAMEMHKHGG